MDGRPHLPQGLTLWSGDSRGRWEGNTLVVDTTNFSPKSNFMGSSGSLHIVERFTRVAADMLQYDVTIDDLTTWTKPWTVSIRMKQSQDKLYEYACHEGNYVTMEGILGAARADERAAEDGADPGRNNQYVKSIVLVVPAATRTVCVVVPKRSCHACTV